MQQLTNIQDLKTAVTKNGEMVITVKNNNIVIMKMEEYRKKGCEDNEDKIEEKLLKAEKQIREGKTVKAIDVFKDLEAQCGF